MSSGGIWVKLSRLFTGAPVPALAARSAVRSALRVTLQSEVLWISHFALLQGSVVDEQDELGISAMILCTEGNCRGQPNRGFATPFRTPVESKQTIHRPARPRTWYIAGFRIRDLSYILGSVEKRRTASASLSTNTKSYNVNHQLHSNSLRSS